jgi:hypothetical protein
MGISSPGPACVRKTTKAPASGGREAAHIVADLGHDDPGAEIADPGDRGQDGDRRAKGLDIGVDLPIDLRNRRVDGIDLLEVQFQQEAVVLSPGRAASREAPPAAP